jgi:hypothetical protein
LFCKLKRNALLLLTSSLINFPGGRFERPEPRYRTLARPAHFLPNSQSFPLSAKPCGFFCPAFKLSSSPTALSHFALSLSAFSTSSADGLKTFAAPPRPTCVSEVDSRRGFLLLSALFPVWRWCDIPDYILRPSCGVRIIVLRHVSTSAATCGVDFAFQSGCFEGNGVEIAGCAAHVACKCQFSIAIGR